jgi:hypothetical protein
MQVNNKYYKYGKEKYCRKNMGRKQLHFYKFRSSIADGFEHQAHHRLKKKRTLGPLCAATDFG